MRKHALWMLMVGAAGLIGCSQTEVTDNSGELGAGDGDRVDSGRDINEVPAVVDGAPDEELISPEDFVLPQLEPASDVYVPASGDFILVDTQTGSRWSARGQAFEGVLAGYQLEQVPSFNAFWFAWSIFYSGSEVWGKDVTNETAAITHDGACAVPCDEIRLGCAGQDCIPALDHDGRDDRPVGRMVPADDPGAAYLSPDDIVLGVYIDGEARAYSHNVLWWHEIYNDAIGGKELSATLCPLTGSGIVFGGTFGGDAIDFGVSGKLYNSNLVMFDRDGDTAWSQMLGKGITGSNIDARLELLPVTETTWARWQELHPDTLVTSDETGHERNYNAYPYGTYRTNDDTFRATNPPPNDALYGRKDLTMGLVGASGARAYVHLEMGKAGDRVIIHDTFEQEPIVVIYEAEHQLAVPFVREIDGQPLTFTAEVAP